MSLIDELETLVKSLTDNNHPCRIVTVNKAYPDSKICDIVTNDGEYLNQVNSSTTATIGDKGLLLYLEGEMEQPFVLLFKNASGIIIDDELSPTSINPVQNRVITNHIYDIEGQIDDLSSEKQDKLVSGTNIRTINGNNLLGSGNITIDPNLDDTGWINVSYQSGWQDYDNTHSLKYRRYGKMVEIRGIAQPSITHAGTSHTIAYISNSTCRPLYDVSMPGKGFTNHHFQINVDTEGYIVINKFYDGITSKTEVTTGDVFIIECTYLIE